MTIVYWAAGWLFGMWVGASLQLPAPLWIVLGAAGFAAAIYWRNGPLPFALFLTLSAASLGAFAYCLSRPDINQAHIAFYNDSGELSITGLVVQPPDIRETYQNLVVEAESIAREDGAQLPVHGRILLRTTRTPIIDYGTRIEANGRPEEPGNSGTFDYQAYLEHRAIYSIIFRPAVTELETGAGNPIKHTLLAVRARAQASINSILPQPQAALLSGILLGDDHAIPDELQEDFRDSGMSHIIVISGFNIAIIAGVLVNGGRHIIGRRPAAWLAIAGISAYSLLVGAEAPVVRAAVMGVLLVIATAFLGRPTFTPAALFAAAFFMTLPNPDILWDVGFQLSFAATLGLMLYVGPWGSEIRTRLQKRMGDEAGTTMTRFVSDSVFTTAAAIIMTLPLLLYHFGTLSLVSPLANLLILPVQPAIMGWGGAATMVGMISPTLGQLPAWGAWMFLTYTIALVTFFGSLPFAAVPLSISTGGLVGSYGLIAAFTLAMRAAPAGDDEQDRSWFHLNGRMQRLLLSGLVVLVILAVVWVWQKPDGNLHVAFLDVGQGDAILIQTPGGKQMLVDGGQYPGLLLSRIGEQMPFWDKKIDLVVATHPDSDHVRGLIDLFANYQVGQVITNGADGESSSDYHVVLETAHRAGIPVRQAISGEMIKLDPDVSVSVLHSGAGNMGADSNKESLVMRLTYGGFSLLLTGDAEQSVEQDMLLAKNDLQSTVLKASHHGSRSASSRSFLQAVNPQIVIISAGRDNRYGHPHTETVERIEEMGATMLRTDELGTIELSSDGRMVWSNVSND